MHAPSERHHDLTAALAGYLGHHGITVAYAGIDGDARWDAARRTFTMRDDAHPHRHLELLRDLIDMVTYGASSRLGAQPRRHLHAVPA